MASAWGRAEPRLFSLHFAVGVEAIHELLDQVRSHLQTNRRWRLFLATFSTHADGGRRGAWIGSESSSRKGPRVRRVFSLPSDRHASSGIRRRARPRGIFLKKIRRAPSRPAAASRPPAARSACRARAGFRAERRLFFSRGMSWEGRAADAPKTGARGRETRAGRVERGEVTF